MQLNARPAIDRILERSQINCVLVSKDIGMMGLTILFASLVCITVNLAFPWTNAKHAMMARRDNTMQRPSYVIVWTVTMILETMQSNNYVSHVTIHA